MICCQVPYFDNLLFIFFFTNVILQVILQEEWLYHTCFWQIISVIANSYFPLFLYCFAFVKNKVWFDSYVFLIYKLFFHIINLVFNIHSV